MPIFYFEARDKTGKLQSGKRTAQTADSLSATLIKEDLIPIVIKTEEESRNRWASFKEALFARPVSLNELGVFSRQMHTLAKTGVPLATALSHLAKTVTNSKFAKALNGIVENLEAGQDLATAMQNYPDIFAPIIISMVKVGQTSGNIAEAFLRINQYLEMEGSAVKNVKTAMRYPTFVVVAVIGAIILINIFVIPAFSNVFKEAHVQLPLMTRVLMAVSSFFVHYWFLLLLLVMGGVGGFYHYIHTPNGRYKWDKFVLHIPIVGKILKKMVLLRFAQSFAIMIDSGIPLIEGIGLISQSVNNDYAKDRISQMRDAIERGNNLSQAASMTNLFTPLELQMLSVSEQTGELSTMLKQIALFYRREIDYDLKRLGDAIEPILIVVLSGVILVLAFAVYLPVWNMAKLAKMG